MSAFRALRDVSVFPRCVGPTVRSRAAMEVEVLRPRGPRLGKVMLSRPSSLNRPHPPHPRAHRDFTAWRLIRNAFAVRERRGDPRVVPGFRCPFLPGMPPSLTPGSSVIVCPDFDADIAFAEIRAARHSQSSRNPFHAGHVFRGFPVHALLRPARLHAPLYGSDRCARPPRAFTPRLPTDRSPSPLLGITTAVTGLLCWRDLHPLEWQLASLHQIVPWSTMCRAGWVRNDPVLTTRGWLLRHYDPVSPGAARGHAAASEHQGVSLTGLGKRGRLRVDRPTITG